MQYFIWVIFILGARHNVFARFYFCLIVTFEDSYCGFALFYCEWSSFLKERSPQNSFSCFIESAIFVMYAQQAIENNEKHGDLENPEIVKIWKIRKNWKIEAISKILEILKIKTMQEIWKSPDFQDLIDSLSFSDFHDFQHFTYLWIFCIF